ncbi:MAG: 2Fe-2S iron-sulfur cluster-binding protein [Pseudomonadota bacterium]
MVRFIEGGETRTVAAQPGQRLLDVAQADGRPLEGTCDGQLACATCHVVVAAEDFVQLPAASANEEDMLDMVAGAKRTSRLACQIVLDAGWSTLTVTIPD